MLVIPAIDMRGGRCVRLRQGDYARETVYGTPADAARRWLDQGARYLHLVDLDGAKSGRPVNLDAVRQVVALAAKYEAPCQLGGGLRSATDLQTVFDLGVARAIVGTKAIREPAWLLETAARFPRRLALGLDARDGLLAVEGWEAGVGRTAADFLAEVSQADLAAVIYTDISKDGMLAGPNFDATEELAKRAAVPVIASGGVTTMDDVLELARRGVPACILGRSLYEETIELPALLDRLRGRT
jgi:phosphoribosylformimino-5-aminoimidazole carboxamide ribotide isomerase